MRALIVVVLAIAGFAIAPSGAAADQPVRVPRVSGELSRAYVTLHRAGLRVTIARRFTLRSDALTVVTSIMPRPGTRVRRGYAVRLTVHCCVPMAHPSQLGGLPAHVPDLTGEMLSNASEWAARAGVRLVASVGGLHAGATDRLLADYRVVDQTADFISPLPATRPVVVMAVQTGPAPCTPPPSAQTLASDAQAIVWKIGLGGSDPTAAKVQGCVKRVNRVRDLAYVYDDSDSDFALYELTISGTELAAVTDTGQGHYGQDIYGLETYDLRTGSGNVVIPNIGPGIPDQLVVNAEGFVAWRVTSTLEPQSTMFNDVSCATVSLCVAVADGNSFISTDPTGGRDAWSQIPDGSSGVSCPTVHLCVSVGGDTVLTSTDPTGGAQAWTTTSLPVTGLDEVTCRPDGLCVAVGDDEVATSNDPTGGAGAWSTGTVSGATDMMSVACPSDSLCVAADLDHGDIETSTDPSAGASTWNVTNIDANNLMAGVSCPNVELCVVTEFGDHVFTSTNPAGGAGAWTAATTPSNTLTRLSCPSASLCVSAALDGVATSVNPTGGSQAWSVAALPSGQGMSCPTVSLCVGATNEGQIMTSTDPTGGAGAWTVSLVDAPDCVFNGGCASEQIIVHDDAGTRTIDRAGPGSGSQLAGLTLTGDVLSWTHDGTPKSATLG